jgi:hypothetical protein
MKVLSLLLVIGVLLTSSEAVTTLTRPAATATTSKKPTVTNRSISTKNARGGASVDKQALRHVIIQEKKAPTKAVVAATRKKASSTSPTSLFPTDAIVGSLAMIALEQGVKRVFAKRNIQFPSSLGGCIVLFFGLLIMDLLVPGSGKSVFDALGPATSLLTKWLPVFFVPGLAMLPLAPSVGSGLEVSVYV